MPESYSQVINRFEAEATELAADMIAKGECMPEEAMQGARYLIKEKWAAKEAHRKFAGDKIKPVSD